MHEEVRRRSEARGRPPCGNEARSEISSRQVAVRLAGYKVG